MIRSFGRVNVYVKNIRVCYYKMSIFWVLIVNRMFVGVVLWWGVMVVRD